MTGDRPPLVLCSGSLGSRPLDEKFRAAAAAGFGWVSVYGGEYDEAKASGLDVERLRNDLGLRVAEVDGVALSLGDSGSFEKAIAIARSLEARSITIVETGAFDRSDESQMADAVTAFGARCDRAAEFGILVHLEPFSWSNLGSTADAVEITTRAARPNGGVLLDLWHHIRGPDGGELDAAAVAPTLLGIQLADVLATSSGSVRNECMTQRQLPGQGHGQLARRLAELAAHTSLPPIGIEVFGEVLDALPAADAARSARDAALDTLTEAGI